MEQWLGSLSILYCKQLLDEDEHDILDCQHRGISYLPQPSALADNTDLKFNKYLVQKYVRVPILSVAIICSKMQAVFLWGKLKENCELLGTDNVQEQISV